MRKIYVVKHKTQKFSFLFKYSLKGNITEFKSDFVMTNAMVESFKSLMPFFESELKKFTKDKWEVQLVDNGLSFTTFWKDYNFPAGDKKKAEKLFNALSEVDQAKAIINVPKYNHTVQPYTNTAKAHATTYLNQRRFDNE